MLCIYVNKDFVKNTEKFNLNLEVKFILKTKCNNISNNINFDSAISDFWELILLLYCKNT